MLCKFVAEITILLSSSSNLTNFHLISLCICICNIVYLDTYISIKFNKLIRSINFASVTDDISCPQLSCFLLLFQESRDKSVRENFFDSFCIHGVMIHFLVEKDFLICIHNPSHNILKPFGVLPNFLSNASETERHHY